MNYQRLLLVANRLIKANGLLVEWQRIRPPVSNPLEPFNPTGAPRVTVHPVWLALCPVGGDTAMNSFVKQLDIEAVNGKELALIPGDIPFVPDDGDVIVLPKDYVIDSVNNVSTRGTDGTLKLGNYQAIRPAGFPILYVASVLS